MTTEQRAFFELVKAGLWGTTADVSAFDSHTDWPRLYKYGKSQTLLGIMLDGIQTLPAELRPERGLYLRWCAFVLQIEERNKKLNREIDNLYKLLRADGVEPVLLKGQGAARNYRNPLHRQCGDIDIYIGKHNFERVNRLLEQDGQEALEVCAKHSAYNWHDVSVENHRILAQMEAPTADRHLQRNIASWHGTDKMVRWELDGCEIVVPPVEFDALFLLQHAVHHLFNLGIGFRQICDWACLLHHNREQLDRALAARELKALGLDRAARIFGALAVKYLGLDEADLPLPFDAKDEADCDWLFDEIWGSGNFGKFDARRTTRPKGYWRGKWHTFTSIVGRNRKLRRVAPAEVFWTPIMRIVNLVWAQFYLRFGNHKG